MSDSAGNRLCRPAEARTALVCGRLQRSVSARAGRDGDVGFGRSLTYTVHGGGFAGSIWYFRIASATFAAGIVPSSESAFSAATTT